MADETFNLIELTADIVSAYVSKNAVPVASMPELISIVNSSLSKIGQPIEPEKPAKIQQSIRRGQCFPTTLFASRTERNSNP